MQQQTEFIVSLGVAHGVARDLVMIGPLREVVARSVTLGERRKRALERQDVQPVARELELPDDLRP